MDNKIKDIDKLIKETLTEEEAKFYDELDEQNLFGMFSGVFKGKLKKIMVLMTFVNLIIFGLLIYCATQFFNVQDTNELIKWSVGLILCVVFHSMIKLYIWMQMDKNALLREIKRLELQVSSLGGKIS